VLHWITILLQNRFFEVKTDIASIGKDFLINKIPNLHRVGNLSIK
jgi:hypothetical protein